MNKNQHQLPDHQTKDQTKISSALSHHMDDEVDHIDFNVTSKLAASRHRAMSQSTPGTGRSQQWVNWQTLTGSIAVLMVALFVGNQLYSPGNITMPPESGNITTAVTSQAASSDLIEDLPLLSASDDIEFYQSIEFLEWMESNAG